MAHQLKPHFCSFQGVRDQLYLQPPTMLEESSSTKAYFSALSFTKPLEKLALCTVSLSVLLDWLSKPGLEARGLDVMAPVLTPALLSGLAGNIVGLERPGMSPPSASFEAEGNVGGFARGPLKSGAPGPSHEVSLDLPIPASMENVLKYEPYRWETSQQDSPVIDVNPEDIAEIVIDDSDDLNKTIEEPQAPIVEPTPSKKHGRDEPVSSSSPSKRCTAHEGDTGAPPLEDDLPKGVKLEDFLPKRYDTLCSDHPWVHKVRCSLLGLEAGTMASREDIDSSRQFVP